MSHIAASVPNHEDETSGNERLVDDPSTKMQTSDIKKPGDVILWWMADKTGRWPILLFLGVFILSFFLVIIALFDYDSVYVTGGVACLIICAFGTTHFKTLMALREQVQDYDALNNKFRTQNAAMLKELSKLKDATTALSAQEERLAEINRESKENLIKFETIKSNLSAMGQSSLQGMGEIMRTLSSLDNRLKSELTNSERSLYLKVFDQMEFKDDKEGMTEEEYNEYLDCLPADHRKRLQDNHTFETLAGEDHTVDIDEFSKMLDSLAGATKAGQNTISNAL